MYILPYYLTCSPVPGTSIPTSIHIMNLLTIGGGELWEEDDQLRVVEDILEPNGLYGSGQPVRILTSSHPDTVIYACPIDPQRTAIDDFYRWKEISKEDRETFCWRTFYRCGTPFFPKDERLGPFYTKEVYAWLNPTAEPAQDTWLMDSS